MHKTRFKDWVVAEVEGKVKAKEKDAWEKARESKDPSKLKADDGSSSEDRYDPLAHSDSDTDAEVDQLDENGEPKQLSSFAVIKKMMKLKAMQDKDPNYF